MPKILTLLGAAALTLALAACGDDGDTGTNEASNPPVELPRRVEDHGTGETRDGELELELDDFYFGPTFIKGEPGESVTLALENEGDARHTFTSADLGVDEEVASGAKAEVTVTLSGSGATRFICRFHENQGMQGAFFFNEGDTIQGGGGEQTTTSSTAAPTGGYGG